MTQQPTTGAQPPATGSSGTAVTGGYASWGKRVLATILDAIILGIPAAIIMSLLGLGFLDDAETRVDPQTGELTGDTSFLTAYFISLGLFQVLYVLYYVYFNGGESGQTLGKKVVGIQTRDQNTGGPLGYGKAFIRWLVATALSFACGIGALIDALFPLWDDKKQTIHDKVANSVVIDTK